MKSREKAREFAKKIVDASDNEVIEGILTTSERVLKRVTDGIYRQPSSALRELISNSYDADAVLVEIQTDPPRFSRIIVRDNGNGLTPAALSYLIHNIGGSPKRTVDGADLGVCSPKDKARSPGGRKLIGKIGIGLFSVSQLTKEFQIITKTKGTDYRTIADVVLSTHSEDTTDDPNRDFAAGTVRIWKVPAEDKGSHGTEVILRNLLQRTVEELTSEEMWIKCRPETHEEMGELISVQLQPPPFHIGCVHEAPPSEFDENPSLPWNSTDDPQERFKKLVRAMDDLRGNTNKNPSISDHLDNYLRMLWVLSLSAPVDYVEAHPFDLDGVKGLRFFHLGNNKGDQAKALRLRKGETLRRRLGLISPERGGNKKFSVIIDGVQLLRPIFFRNLPRTLESVPYTLLFVGKDRPDLSSFPESVRGGDLCFEAYFLWSHVVVPKEHSGVLLRVNDSNGDLFDSTFMHHPTSEQQRKRQVVAEIFVTSGLEAALNIDRESFNHSHPHFQYITHWVHNAFRQFATKHKAIAKEIRTKTRERQANRDLKELKQRVNRTLRSVIPDEDTHLPAVAFTGSPEEQKESRREGVLAFQKSKIFGGRKRQQRITPDSKNREAKFEAQIEEVARVLDAFGVFDDMPYEKQERLLKMIADIFST